MNDQIEKILKFHQETNPGVTIVEVTTTRWYEIPVGSSTPINELLEEWFKNKPVSKSHAGRDGSLLVECFNDDAKIIDPLGE